MCNIKFIIFIFLYYHKIGYCGLKLFKYRPYYPSRNYNFGTNSIQSPCPNIFEYRYDDSGRLYGFLEIQNPNTNAIEVEVEFCVGNRVNKGAEGSLTLPYQNDEQIIESLQQSRPINYRLNFPTWRGPQPKITKIVVNKNIICTGEPYPLSLVPILTTINLRHKLQINLSPTILDIQNFENNHNNQNNIDVTTNSFFDVRNDKRNVENPHNFRPDSPKVVPEIIFKPDVTTPNSNFYDMNPFLNSLSTTRSPDIDFGKDIFNNQKFIPTSTEKYLGGPNDDSIQTSYEYQDSNNFQDGTSQNLNDVCGRPVITNSLVLHGHNVPRGAYPWLVAMFLKTNTGGLEYHCTATLITKKHVVTAAHCVKRDSYVLDPEKIVLVMGRINIQNWEATDGEKILGVDQIFIYPKYKSNTADADISLLVMKYDVTFSKFIRPICIWSENDNLNFVVGKRGTVVGWGKDENGLKVSPEPKQLSLPIVSQEQCLRSNYSFADITSERTFCAGDRNGSGPCNGDSGSGFVMLMNGRWHLRGIVSMSLSDAYTRTCDLFNYVVFTDASKYSTWLSNLINK